jgi:hypothetical protein
LVLCGQRCEPLACCPRGSADLCVRWSMGECGSDLQDRDLIDETAEQWRRWGFTGVLITAHHA